MRKFFIIFNLILSLALLAPLPALAGSCFCRYNAPDSQGSDSTCISKGTAKNESDCNAINNVRDENNGYYDICKYYSNDSCKNQCEVDGLFSTTKYCTVDGQCSVGIGVAKCCSNQCYFDETALQIRNNGTVHGQSIKFTKPVIEISIPGVNFTETKDTLNQDGKISVPYLAEYITGIYKFAVAAASLVAVIVIILNGFRITVSGGGEEKNKGIQNVGKAITGLFILWSSYALFYTINPSLTQFQPLLVQYIDPLPYAEGGDSNSQFQGGTPSQTVFESSIYCPKSGGAKEIPKIAMSMAGKVAYRFGGKGGPPPYSEVNKDYIKYNNYCPVNNVCLDCSGFIGYVYYCAGLTSPGAGTSGIFADATTITVNDVNIKNNTVGNIQLAPGDLLGWLSDGTNVGHVIIYIGNGQVAEAYGGDSGRRDNANPLIRAFNTIDLKTYKFTRIRRVTN